MRQGQQNKRPRGRGRKNSNPLTRSYESNGGDVKIRGTAMHIAEKYVQLSRDAQVAGDRVAGESYLQHAEHYFRIIAVAQAAMPQQPVARVDQGGEDGAERNEGRGNGHRNQQSRPANQPTIGPDDPQPFANGGSGEATAQTSLAEGESGADATATDSGPEAAGGSGETSGTQAEARRSRGGRGSRRRQPYRDRSGEANGREASAAAQPESPAPQSEPSLPSAAPVAPAAPASSSPAEPEQKPSEQTHED